MEFSGRGQLDFDSEEPPPEIPVAEFNEATGQLYEWLKSEEEPSSSTNRLLVKLFENGIDSITRFLDSAELSNQTKSSILHTALLYGMKRKNEKLTKDIYFLGTNLNQTNFYSVCNENKGMVKKVSQKTRVILPKNESILTKPSITSSFG